MHSPYTVGLDKHVLVNNDMVVSLPGSYLGIQLVVAAAVPIPVAGQRETAWSLSRHRRTDQQLQLQPPPPPQLPPVDCWGCSSRTFSGEPAGRWAT